MTVELNHTIIRAYDKVASARFLAGILGLPVGEQIGPFMPIRLGNNVTLDYADADADADTGGAHPQHYAFLVSESEFDAAFTRIKDAGVAYYADPAHQRPGEINHLNGGRGFYFDDPNGHNMELLTRP